MYDSPFKHRLRNGQHMMFELEAVHPCVPFLLGLDVVPKFAITLDFITGTIRAVNGAWVLSFNYVGDHAFGNPNTTRSMFPTKAELQDLHLQFYHPSSRKKYHFLKRVKPSHTPSAVLNTLKKITEAWSTCKELYAPPFGFRVPLPEDYPSFNASVAMDLVWIDRRPDLHIIDTPTSYQKVAFGKDKSADGLWKFFLEF